MDALGWAFAVVMATLYALEVQKRLKREGKLPLQKGSL